MEPELWHFLCEERYGKVINIKSATQTERIARFLKPCASTFSEAERVSSRAPLVFEELSSRTQKWPRKLNFRGWSSPQKNWNEWVESLAPQHCIQWQEAGITDALMSSCYEIKCNKEIVLGLAEFWCPETNTFVFPWGEATITLEDVMILGGFPVLGESVMKPVTNSEVVDAMRERKSAMSKERAKKASHGPWLKHFMKNNSRFEHEAFLSLWLSRFVFPSLAKNIISEDVFPIAAHLCRGTQMALAPAVLAGLYKSLSLLKKQAIASSEAEITIFTPFQIVLMWAFEHFPQLLQKPPNELNPGEPRAARWHRLYFKTIASLITTVLNSRDSFEWRPYAAEITNWNHSSYYRSSKHLLIDREKNCDEELKSYGVCLQMSHLVGVNCRERYMPHRVAMQFGMDQDLPGEFSDLEFGIENANFFVPPKSFKPGISARYFNWWKNCEFFCKGSVLNFLRKNLVSFQEAKEDKHDIYIISEGESSEGSPSIEEVKSGAEDSKGIDDDRLSDCGDNADALSGRATLNIRKRNFSDELPREAGDSAKHFKRDVKEDSTETTDLEECEKNMAEVPFNYVENNDFLQTATTFEDCDLENRVQKLEKLLGLIPDVG